jgi:hypothetical protein
MHNDHGFLRRLGHLAADSARIDLKQTARFQAMSALRVD